MDTATYKVYVDWDNNGNFTGTYDDISAYVVKNPFAWRTGRASDTEYDSAGVALVTLDNTTSIFSSFNSSSAIYGKILPNLPVKITMKIGEGSEVTMFQGFLDSIVPEVGMNCSTATLTAHGRIAQFVGTETEIALDENEETGTLATALLTAMGLAAGDMTVGTGQRTLS